MQVLVETRENELGDCEPCRFSVGVRRLDVVAVLDRWLHPDHGYFKVKGSDDAIYILRLDVPSGRWEIALYESGHRPDQPAVPAVKQRH
jgi:hypothetical protein